MRQLVISKIEEYNGMSMGAVDLESYPTSIVFIGDHYIRTS